MVRLHLFDGQLNIALFLPTGEQNTAGYHWFRLCEWEEWQWSWVCLVMGGYKYLENKLLLISINFTPKTSHSCLKMVHYVFQAPTRKNTPPILEVSVTTRDPQRNFTNEARWASTFLEILHAQHALIKEQVSKNHRKLLGRSKDFLRNFKFARLAFIYMFVWILFWVET